MPLVGRVFVCAASILLSAGAIFAQTDPGATSSLTLVSGSIAGQAVSATNHTIAVSPGAPIAGTYTVQINSSFGGTGFMPLAVTPSWGDHATSFKDVGTFSHPAINLQRTISINFTAPSTPGIYYITAAFYPEISVGSGTAAAYLMSATHFTIGVPLWDNGDDIAGWSAATIASANQNGRTKVPYWMGSQSQDVWVPATSIIVSVLDASDPGVNSTVSISTGSLAGQVLSTGNRVISVNPGGSISGSVTYQVKTAFVTNVPVVMALTPTWGTHSSSVIDAGTIPSPSTGTSVTVPLNLTAPNTKGSYYIIAGVRPEYSAAQVASATDWTVASPVWDDGDDLASWSAQTIATANTNGNVLVPFRYASGSIYQYVPAAAIQVVVTDDPGAQSTLQLVGGTINGQNLSSFSRAISVDPGATLTGNFIVSVNSTYPASSNMVLASTPTWGTHSTSFSDLGTFTTPISGLLKTVPVNLTAPATPGTYYIIAAYKAESSAAQLMSGTDASVGAPAWTNGDDIADWTAANIDAANQNGRTLVNYAFASGTIPQYIPATAVRVVVGGIASSALRFVPLTPCRVADTRLATAPLAGPALVAGETRTMNIAGVCGIPIGAAAYSLNVTAVPSGTLGYLSIWPTGQAQPLVSTLNSLDGRIKANAAIVPAGTNGGVNVYVTNPSNVVLDVNGYFIASNTAQTLAFYPLTPCRVADTRNATGVFGGPTLNAGQVRDFPIPGSSCNVPSTARAYSLNVTVVPSGPLGYLTAWPTGSSQPFVSILNAPTGAVTANAAIVPAGMSGSVSMFSTNQTDLIIDINGYFAPADVTGLSFYAVTPCRVSDTRNTNGNLGGPVMQGGQSRSWPVTASNCGLPSNARAYSVNATVVPQGYLGFLTLWPSDGQMPLVSTLNSFDASITSNAAIVPASQAGSISSYTTNQTDLVLDINGYFAP